MGVDVQIGVEGAEWLPDHPLAFRVRELLDVDQFIDQQNGWLEIGSCSRYYGPGYERGQWPAIYGAIRAVMVMYPDKRITYGGDGTDVDQNPVVTLERLEEIWAHWLGPDSDAYHERWRRQTGST